MTASASPEPLLPPDPRAHVSPSGEIPCPRHLQHAAQLCGILLVLLGLSVLVGWLLHIELLMTVLPGHIRMKANTALGFLLAGGALLLAVRISSQPGPSTWVLPSLRLLAAVTFLCGAVTLVQYIFHIDLHIDELLFPDPIQFPYPGRMAHLSAVNFCLCGLSLLLCAGGPRARLVAQGLAIALASGAFVGIIGYLYGVPIFYGSSGYTSMALHTGIAFLVVGFGIVAAQSQSRLIQVFCADEPGSWLARRLLPFIAAGPVVLGWLYLHIATGFSRPRFAMALFAVTVVACGLISLWFAASFLNQAEHQRTEIARIREESAAAVNRSERELRLVTDHLPILLSYIDKDGRLLRVNRTYEDWLGLPAAEIVGRTVADLLGHEYWSRTLPLRERALSGETATIETPYPTVRGDRRAQVTYAPDLTPTGEVRGIACMVIDVDDHRRAEAALRQSEKLAAVGRLASSIAHEINNPLEAVTNLLYLLEQDTLHQHEAHAYVVQAQEELARVTHIVVQTLRFHRQATHPTLCQPSDLLDQILSLFRGRLSSAGIQVQLRVRKAEPLLCHEGEIRQVLANLVGNAIDAMPTGGRLFLRTAVLTGTRTGHPGIVLTVADTGHGIPPSTLHKLFEPFHTTKGAKGSGLGLWISKEIVERHGGSLRVRSSQKPEARGTTFRVLLPR